MGLQLKRGIRNSTAIRMAKNHYYRKLGFSHQVLLHVIWKAIKDKDTLKFHIILIQSFYFKSERR